MTSEVVREVVEICFSSVIDSLGVVLSLGISKKTKAVLKRMCILGLKESIEMNVNFHGM